MLLERAVKAAWLGIEKCTIAPGNKLSLKNGGEGKMLCSALYRGDNQEMNLRETPTISLPGF